MATVFNKEKLIEIMSEIHSKNNKPIELKLIFLDNNMHG